MLVSLHVTDSIYAAHKCPPPPPHTHTVMNMGQAVSPVFRFMTSSGDWVWMQMEGMLRYKQGTDEPQFWEVKAKLIR